MKEIELEVENLDFPQRHGEAFNLMLKEKNGTRYIPIVIGVYEAKNIILEVNKIKIKRPLAHDLFIQLCEQLNAEVKKILIVGYKSGIYYVQIQFTHQGEAHHIDSRVSDAVIIALKKNIPIFVTEEVFNEASYDVGDLSDAPIPNAFNKVDISAFDTDDDANETYNEEDACVVEGEVAFIIPNDAEIVLQQIVADEDPELVKQFTLDELKILLEKALESEIYEAAAKIDDEINRRENHES